MKSKSFCLSVKTKEAPEFIDITEWVSGCVTDSKVNNGFAVVYLQAHYGGGEDQRERAAAAGGHGRLP